MDERPFVDTPIGDASGAARAASIIAADLGLAPPTLLRVGMNALFRSDDVVLRVGRPSVDANLGIALALRLRDLGIVTPRPRADEAFAVGQMSVTLWQFCVATEEPIAWNEVGRLIRIVHGLALDDIPDGYPIPHPRHFPWWNFELMLADVSDSIDDRARRGLEEAIARHHDWHQFESVVICHGDVHPGNVVMTAEGPILLDWDLLCAAPLGWDHAMLTTYADRWGGSDDAYPAFADGYGLNLANDPQTQTIGELRNVAATLMRVKASIADPSAASEANRRLEYWRGVADPPVWRAQ